MWRIEFSSNKFLPYLPESAQQNPGAYGFELAHWLSIQLAARGIPTGYPLGEDWGWFIEYFEGELEIMIGCASEAQGGEGYTGAPLKWRIFVRQPGALRRKLKRQSPSPKVEEIARAVGSVLENAGLVVVLSEA